MPKVIGKRRLEYGSSDADLTAASRPRVCNENVEMTE